MYRIKYETHIKSKLTAYIGTSLFVAMIMAFALMASAGWSAQASGLSQEKVNAQKGVQKGPPDSVSTVPAAPLNSPASPDCSPDWATVTSANWSITNYLQGVAVVSANDVWAVGYTLDGSVYKTLIEHWNGSSWSIVSSPSPGTGEVRLNDVAAAQGGDVWAVGTYTSGGVKRTLIERWSGGVWSVSTGANVNADTNVLSGVAAASGSDVWAVGYYRNVSRLETLIERWNGSSWSVVASPNGTPYDNSLQDVAVVSGSDVWVVGSYINSSSVHVTLIEHWNGGSWTIVSSPNPGTGGNNLFGVTATPGGDVWAVGYYYDIGEPDQTLIMHWTGGGWSVVASPNPGAEDNELKAVSASGNDVWAVGYYQNSLGGAHLPLIEHWVGSGWFVVPGVIVTPSYNEFLGVATVSGSDAWAVGYYYVNTGNQTLVQRWNGGAWNVVPSPSAGMRDNVLRQVTALSDSNIWAVGYYTSTTTHSYQTLIEHWDGAAWSVIPSPNIGTGNNFLYGVEAASASSIWAVGFYEGVSGSQTLIEWWNGGTWGVLGSPSPGTQSNLLYDVAVVGPSDVWAVGTYFSTSNQTLIEHWTGGVWTVVSSPSPGTGNILNGVAAVSPGDVWAVGTYFSSGVYHTLIEHWAGSVWTVVTSPNVGTGNNILVAVEAPGFSSSDVWAVGSYNNGTSTRTLIEHWTGGAWVVVASPNVGTGNNALRQISGLSAGDIWAVGEYISGTLSRTLIEHWDGGSWSAVYSPNAGTGNNYLDGVKVVSAGNIWATGSYGVGSKYQTLAERYNPCTPSCPLQFSDVPSGSTFYPFVRCLACRGFVNGYADGTFKPNNLVTRGQLSKIVSNAAGFNDVPPGQLFQDILPGSTFYMFVQRLASRGYISGYPCGGAGEPCVPPGNLPYFRPNTNATRGQISKIDSNAAGYSDTPSGQQFQDVAVGSTYYVFTYRLVSRSIMAGYPCGGAGEPCVPPGNLPYFRPNTNATRGQTSKIVANTFIPNCYTPLEGHK